MDNPRSEKQTVWEKAVLKSTHHSITPQSIIHYEQHEEQRLYLLDIQPSMYLDLISKIVRYEGEEDSEDGAVDLRWERKW